jgi:hypothetical protein
MAQYQTYNDHPQAKISNFSFLDVSCVLSKVTQNFNDGLFGQCGSANVEK